MMDPVISKMDPVNSKTDPINSKMDLAGPKVDLVKMKTLRRRKGISQREMAKTLGYKSAVGYHYLETGRCTIQAEQLFRIAQRLGVPIDELFLHPSCTDMV